MEEIARFVRALFAYAEQDTFISLRAFDQFNRSVPPVIIRGVRVNGSVDAIIRDATIAAEDASQHENPTVFCPPIATFTGAWKASTTDLANGLTLSVELDDTDPDAGQRILEEILGPVTVLVRSGSDWIDASTGEIKPKIHLHWRLTEPTTTAEEHERLRQARTLATLLIGGDPTGKPVVHPLRWPGSWNLKTSPRMATIGALNETAEINLDDALEALELATDARGMSRRDNMPGASSTPEARLSDVRSAMASIPNFGVDVHYEEWIKFGYAIRRATGGGQHGFDIWDNWSRLSEKYNADETAAAWRRIDAAVRGGTPERTIGAGTIFFHATRHGWVRPFPLGGNGEAHDSAGFEEPGQTGHETGTNGTKDVPVPFDLVWFQDIRPNLDAADFVEGTLIEGAMSVIYGESNCGKTFFATDLALHIVLAWVWRGLRTERGGVIYCALEGAHGISNRVAAFRKHYNLGEQDLPFAIIPSAINMLDPDADTPRLVASIQAAASRIEDKVLLVVIDTLSRAMAGGNENAPDDMGAVVMNTDKVRQATGAHIAYVHHSGKDTAKGARGHSLLRAATDTEIEIVRPDKNSPSIATVTKQREMEIEGRWAFRLEVVELGKNRHGKPVTSCVVVEAERDAGDRRGRPVDIGGQSGIALMALRAAVASPESAIIPPFEGIPNDTRGVHVEVWRRYFYEKMPTITQDARKKAFQRTSEYLTRRRLIGVRDPWVWLV